jgi:hypothetical protein
MKLATSCLLVPAFPAPFSTLDDTRIHNAGQLGLTIYPWCAHQAEGIDNCQYWTAIGEKCHHDHNQFRRLV